MHSRLSIFVLAFVFTLPVAAATYFFPYVVEGNGTAAAGSAGVPFDTSFVMATTDGLASMPALGGATFDIYLFDSLGAPSKSATAISICDPCSFFLNGTTTHRVDFRLHDQILAVGGFPPNVIVGSALVVVSGAGVDHARIDEVIRDTTMYAAPGDANGDDAITPTDVFYLINRLFSSGAAPVNAKTEIQELRLEGSPVPTTETTLVIPDVVEKKGLTSATPFTSDVIFHMASAGGHGSVPNGGDAAVDIYLYQDSGAPMVSGTGLTICDPCSFAVQAGKRAVFKIEDQVNGRGGWGALTSLKGFAIVQFAGADPGSVAITTLEINARSNSSEQLIRTLPASDVVP